MEFLEYLLIFILVIYGLRLLFRLALPYLVKYLFKKTQQNMEQQFGARPGYEEKEEGEVTINYSAEKDEDRLKNDSAGEYVDFEDVD